MTTSPSRRTVLAGAAAGVALSPGLALAAALEDDPRIDAQKQGQADHDDRADAAAAHDMITARFDYSFTWGAMALMVVVIVGYFAMMLRLSEKEYREVIDEKFER